MRLVERAPYRPQNTVWRTKECSSCLRARPMPEFDSVCGTCASAERRCSVPGLREARKTAGFTQDLLAYAVGVCSGTVGRWERGEERPSAERVAVLADVLMVSVGALQRP